MTITSPLNGAIFAPPANFQFAATASDLDPDGLSDVAFYLGANLVEDVYYPNPFVVQVNIQFAGTYALTAVATDYVGASTTNSITIRVGTSPPALGIGTYSNQPAVFFPAAGTNFILQMTTNLAFPNWVTVSNGVPISHLLHVLGVRHSNKKKGAPEKLPGAPIRQVIPLLGAL